MAISYSLEPYRRLLGKMRENKDIDCDFVKNLLQDIFDNPIKRLYQFQEDRNGESSEKQTEDQILASIKQMPDEMKKIVIQSINNLLPK
ncbi:MAG: hypothetical protein ABFD79_05145 [Phycisphaerales bacterium]